MAGKLSMGLGEEHLDITGVTEFSFGEGLLRQDSLLSLSAEKRRKQVLPDCKIAFETASML